jgi:hypothetical protein
MKMVKECWVEEGTALMYTATSLIVKPDFREVFSSLETIEGRLDLIRRVSGIDPLGTARKLSVRKKKSNYF